MLVPVSPLYINQHSSTDFPQDFSLKCIKHIFCSLLPNKCLGPYNKTERISVLLSFVSICLCICLDYIIVCALGVLYIVG